MRDMHGNPISFIEMDSYRYFNYAILHTRGLSHVLDTMRYDKAFLARRSDLQRIIEAATAQTAVLTRFSILLCKYDYHGPTKANWTHARLMSTQEYEEVNDPMKLVDLGADQTTFRPKKGLKIRTEIEITGKLPEILQIMYDNKGLPADEGVAHAIKQAFWTPIDADPFTVKLVNYQEREEYWRINKTPA